MKHDTRDRLLTAAIQVFADKGFENAGLREICDLAGTNVASVRYHFDDKASLYRTALQTAQTQAFTARPMPGRTDDPEADLLAWINWFLVTGHSVRGQPFGQLMLREMMNPTDALDLMAEQGARPVHAHLTGVINSILGPEHIPPAGSPPAEEVAVCVIGMCIHRIKAYPMISRILRIPGDRYAPAPEDLPKIAETITHFCLMGLKPRPSPSSPSGS